MRRFWRWYDEAPEPMRLLVFTVMVIAPICAMQYSDSLQAFLTGAAYLLSLVVSQQLSDIGP